MLTALIRLDTSRVLSCDAGVRRSETLVCQLSLRSIRTKVHTAERLNGDKLDLCKISGAPPTVTSR